MSDQPASPSPGNSPETASLGSDPQTLSPGDLLRSQWGQFFLVEARARGGIRVEALHAPRYVEGRRQTHWTKNAGHGGFFRWPDFLLWQHAHGCTRIGSLPGMLERRSLYVDGDHRPASPPPVAEAFTDLLIPPHFPPAA